MTALREAAAVWKEFDNERDRAVFSRDTLKSAMAALRAPIDKLERMVSRADWPVPTYAELMDEN
jgi:glutamine synthetase